MKTTVRALSLLLVFLLSANVSFGAEVFTRYLQKGDQGTDVIVLQRVLNSNPNTRIAETGTGSLGNETDYFGELTKQALIKYQKLNSLGSQFGFFSLYSGAVDEKTRNFLNNSLASSTATTTAQMSLNASYQEGVGLTDPFIGSVSPTTVKDGDTVTISGRNFSTVASNVVNLGFNSVSATSTDGKTLKIKVDSALQDMFDKEAKNLTSSQKSKVRSEMSNIPLFATVSNSKGVSNPYQLYFSFK